MREEIDPRTLGCGCTLNDKTLGLSLVGFLHHPEYDLRFKGHQTPENDWVFKLLTHTYTSLPNIQSTEHALENCTTGQSNQTERRPLLYHSLPTSFEQPMNEAKIMNGHGCCVSPDGGLWLRRQKGRKYIVVARSYE